MILIISREVFKIYKITLDIYVHIRSDWHCSHRVTIIVDENHRQEFSGFFKLHIDTLPLLR